jgi:hypothetical protein
MGIEPIEWSDDPKSDGAEERDGERRQLRVKVKVAVAICRWRLVLSLTCTEIG